MRKLYYATAIFLSLLILGALYALFPSLKESRKESSAYEDGFVEINGVRFHVAVSDTTLERSQGLSGREPLKPDEGMWFIFPYSTVQNFWMYDMKFPIDIIWVGGGKIVGFSENAPVPEPGMSSYDLPLYSSQVPADKVFEVAAGTVARHGFKVGDGANFVQK